MKFDRPQQVSFKPVDDGDYVGVIVGFSYIGMHPTNDYGDKPKVMIRWEIHDLDPPNNLCVDDEKLPHVVSQTFPATIRGDSSWLYKCLQAHGIAVPGGSVADSKDWYGRVAKLTIEGAQGKRGNRVFMNVTDITPLGQNVNIRPTLSYEHWEPEDDAPPPMWARAMIEKSNDIYKLASQARGGQGSERGGAPAGRAPAPAGGNQGGDYRPPAAPSGGYRPPEGDDDEDIPF